MVSGHRGLPSFLTKEDSFVHVCLEACRPDRLLAVQFRGGHAEHVLVS